MSLNDTVQARAGKPSEPNNEGMDDLYAAIVALSDRLSAIEAKPLARDGRDGSPGRDGGIGAHGEPGVRGEVGPQGQPGPEGRGIVSAAIDANGDLLLTMTDGEVIRPGRVVGRDGEDGAQGETGPRGEQGPEGVRGEVGPQGEIGVSIKGATITDDNLYLTLTDGTSILAGTDLRGPQGEVGPRGAAGEVGPKGEAGPRGEAGPVGDIGPQGEPGVRGEAGERGVSISDVAVSEDGVLTVSLSNGTSLFLGNISGPQGMRGEIGPQGDPGIRGEVGEAGADGVSVTDVAVSEDGVLTVSLSNGTSLFLGNISGPQGDPGPRGEAGELDESRLAALVAPTIERQATLASAIASADIINKLNSRIDQILMHFTAPAQSDTTTQPKGKS